MISYALLAYIGRIIDAPTLYWILLAVGICFKLIDAGIKLGRAEDD